MSYSRNTENFWDSGTTDTFAIPTSGYLGTYFNSVLKVEIGGVLKTLGVDYTIPAGTHVITTSPVDCAVTPVRIYRDTFSLTNPQVTFPDVTTLNSKKHLNKSTWNLWWLIEEIKDMFAKTISAVVSGSSLVWDCLNYKITNVGQGSSASDAARISDVTAGVATAESYADAAVAVETSNRQAADASLTSLISTTDANRKIYVDAQDASVLAGAKIYTDSTDANRKIYVDAQDASVLAGAKSYASGLNVTQSENLANAVSYLLANDAIVLEAAKAYARGWLASINYLIAPVSDMVINSWQPLTAGQTRVYLPIDATGILVFVGGILQRPTVDYTILPGAAYFDFTTPVPGSGSYVFCMIFKSLDGLTTLVSQEDVSASLGDTVVTFSGIFDNALVFIDGVFQDNTNYSHTVGTDSITLGAALPEAAVVSLVKFSTPVYAEESVTVLAGATTVNYSVSYNNSLVFIEGICQRESLDYTHGFGSDTMYLTNGPTETSKVTRVMF